MKKAICVMLVVALVTMLCGCGRKAGEGFSESERFVIVSGDNPNAPYYDVVIADKDTGVLYIVFYVAHHFGIAPLLDSNGKPLLWEGAE